MKSNLIIILGIVVMVLVIFASKYVYQPATQTDHEDSQVTYSGDRQAFVNVSEELGLSITPLTPWQVVSADVLSGTFLYGYEIQDSRNALNIPALMSVSVPGPLPHVPTVFKTVAGLTTLVDDVTYLFENGNLTATEFLITGPAKIYALDHYSYRNSSPVVNLVTPVNTKTLMPGNVSEHTLLVEVNDDYAIYGQGKGTEQALKLVPDTLRASVEYYLPSQVEPVEVSPVVNIPYLDLGSIPLEPAADICTKTESGDIDAKIKLSYTAELYERVINDWLRVPVSDVEFQLIEGATQTYTESFYIRQQFKCVAL